MYSMCNVSAQFHVIIYGDELYINIQTYTYILAIFVE